MSFLFLCLVLFFFSFITYIMHNYMYYIPWIWDRPAGGCTNYHFLSQQFEIPWLVKTWFANYVQLVWQSYLGGKHPQSWFLVAYCWYLPLCFPDSKIWKHGELGTEKNICCSVCKPLKIVFESIYTMIWLGTPVTF